MNSKLQKILDFLHLAEGLKKELRHSYLSDGRQESVAEHTWRMTLMALVLHPEIEQQVDLFRVIKMIIIHDLGEVYIGDYHVYGGKVPENKHQLEAAAMQKLLKLVPNTTREEIYELWMEFEERQTPEAKFAVALDKLEVIIQHNEADVSTYIEGEGEFNLTYADDKVAHDETLKLLREIIRDETKRKIGK